MDVKHIITPDRILCHTSVSSKKRVLELLSELLAKDSDVLSQQEIFESLLNREKLGTTSLGHGVALPHGRLQKTDKALGAFIQLDDPIDYDASDNRPVDLLFALLVPQESTDQHLQLLASLAESFSSEAFRERLRSAPDSEAVYKLFSDQG